MEVRYITCNDCETEWINRCGVCKKKAWQIKNVRKRKPKVKITRPKRRVKRKKREEGLREYFSRKHPKRVVSLIMLGHDAACGCCHSIDNLTFDHVIPIVLGGKNSLRNGQILCHDCNQLKGGRLIEINELRIEAQQLKLS